MTRPRVPSRAVAGPGWLIVLTLTSGPARPRGTPQEIDFNRDIRPILSENCFACHGQDASHRKADLRLDVREAAIEAGAIVPGDAEASALVERIMSEEPSERMPPPKSHRVLTAGPEGDAEAVDRRGGEVPGALGVRRARAARAAGGDAAAAGCAMPIDRFVLAKLEADGPAAVARGRPGHADPPPVARPARPAADGRGGRGVRRRSRPEGLREPGRAPAREPALRRAPGPRLARRGPLRRHERLLHRRRPAHAGSGATG